MTWAIVFLVLATAGLVVIGVASVRVFVAVRGLGREIQRTRDLLEVKQSTLKSTIQHREG
ncbi:hypothetical protein [Bailinhaonella thermotolerans]|uniref:Uncharacterized protein n=1 Tax=Bailinhaonella thermotolerans TaxID=1070861 RepID=A0A3A4AZ49_9ACTN|nr:hypothetical protein [Bailinhaonella thermotolerans]RJL35962.1 hypothetical protein D5H75_04120 [Bailinhaonella thermotolerans]